MHATRRTLCVGSQCLAMSKHGNVITVNQSMHERMFDAREVVRRCAATHIMSLVCGSWKMRYARRAADSLLASLDPCTSSLLHHGSLARG